MHIAAVLSCYSFVWLVVCLFVLKHACNHFRDATCEADVNGCVWSLRGCLSIDSVSPPTLQARDQLEKVSELLVTDRCTTFEECVAWARHKFQVWLLWLLLCSSLTL